MKQDCCIVMISQRSRDVCSFVWSAKGTRYARLSWGNKNRARSPYNSFAPINGFIYFIMVSLFLFLDVVKKKSRPFVLAVGILFVVTTLWNIYTLTFTGSSVGIILFQYGDDYVLRKRPFKRSCFLQILLFSLNGVWTMFIDKKMDTMMFATGHVYRETGTASKYVEDRQYSTQWRSESG